MNRQVVAEAKSHQLRHGIGKTGLTPADLVTRVGDDVLFEVCAEVSPPDGAGVDEAPDISLTAQVGAYKTHAAHLSCASASCLPEDAA